MIKKTKRQHHLWADWQKIKKSGIKLEAEKHAKALGIKHHLFDRPLAGRWYYTYSNDKGMAVGLAKLQDHNFTFTKGYHKKWMWETCTANEKLELRRFPTQKAAEKAITEFLEPKKLSYKSRKEK
jgi:hypothetical protein